MGCCFSKNNRENNYYIPLYIPKYRWEHEISIEMMSYYR